jgi:hypothetical protein
MSLFHVHEWETTGAEFNPGVLGLSKATGSYEFMMSLAYGFTNITQKCQTCGRVEVTTASGRASLAGTGLSWKK